jgi:hypothetical protein
MMGSKQGVEVVLGRDHSLLADMLVQLNGIDVDRVGARQENAESHDANSCGSAASFRLPGAIQARCL